MLTLAQVKSEYDVDQNGIIRSPGQHEGNPSYVPALWSEVIEGSSESIFGGEENGGELLYDIVGILPEDWKEFPALQDCTKATLEQSENGFIYCSVE